MPKTRTDLTLRTDQLKRRVRIEEMDKTQQEKDRRSASGVFLVLRDSILGRSYRLVRDHLRNALGWIHLLLRCALDVEALLAGIIICPMLFLALVIWLQVYHPPIGAILFYSVYIPLIMSLAVIDYLRKRS